MKVIKAICLLFLLSVCASAQTFDVTTYGATPNDATDDDSPSIQAAITAATSVKGTVVVPLGTFDIASSIILPSGVTLRGAGMKSSFLQAKSGFTVGSEGSLVEWNNVNSVTVKGLGFLSSATVANGFGVRDSAYSTVEACYFDAGLARSGIINGIRMFKFTMRDCISGGGSIAENFALVDGSYCLIENNLFTRPPASNFNGIELALSMPGLMTGNKIAHNTFVNQGVSGIGLGGDTGTIIEGNTFTNCGYGVYTGTWIGVPSTNVTIRGNTVNNPTYAGFLIHTDARQVTITGNTVKNSAAHGILVDGESSTITGNTITGTAFHGIGVNGSFNSITANTVTNGGINQPGIVLSGAHNMVSGNISRGQAMGIQLVVSSADNVYGINDTSDNWFAAVVDQGTNNKTVVLQ